MVGNFEEREKVRERRKMMLKFHFRGIPTGEWVARLAQKYVVTEIAIWQDWRRRKSWLSKVFNLDDVVDEINMNLVELMNVKEEAWRTYEKATNAQSKAAALKIIVGAIRDKIEILQSLGEIHKEPIKIKGEVAVGVVVRGILEKYEHVVQRVAEGNPAQNDP